MIIYKATNKINGKAYVGQTVFSLENRRDRHIREALNRKDNCYFHRAIRKYGIEKFDWEILQERDTIEDLNRLEMYYIGLYDTFEKGYNLTLGGKGSIGFKHTKESRKKMSEVRIGMKPSEGAKKKISESLIGRKFSEETKRKMSKAQSGKKHPMYGKKHTEESKLKMSLSRMGNKNHFHGKYHTEETKRNMSQIRIKKGLSKDKNNPRARPVIINNKHFDTRKQAAEYLNVSPTTVRDRIKRQVLGYQYG